MVIFTRPKYIIRNYLLNKKASKKIKKYINETKINTTIFLFFYLKVKKVKKKRRSGYM